MEITGKIKVVEAETQVSASFKKRGVAVTTDEQYPQTIYVEFTQDKTDLLNGVKVGDTVKISINLGGREWVNPQGETKYFNSIRGWRVEKLQGKSDSAVENYQNQQPAQAAAPQTFQASANFKEDEHDDLPF